MLGLTIGEFTNYDNRLYFRSSFSCHSKKLILLLFINKLIKVLKTNKHIWLSLIAIFLSLCPVSIKCQQLQNDNKYILNYSDKLSVKIFGVLKSNVVSHFDFGTQTNIDYKPNENFNIGFGVGHKWLGIDLALNLGFINDDNNIFGETTRFDLQSSIYLKKFVFDIHYQKYKGYYASKPWVFLDGYEMGDLRFPIRSDITTLNTSISALYVFKPQRFSYKAAFIYNQRQLKSGGSFLAGSYVNMYKMNADYSIIPENSNLDFDREVDFRGTRFLSFGLSVGYGHSFIIGSKFFFSLSVNVGFGPSIKKYSNDLLVKNPDETHLSVRGAVRSAIGYNTENNFFGISSVASNSTEVSENEPHLARSVSIIKIFYGRRFKTPKVIKKVVK